MSRPLSWTVPVAFLAVSLDAADPPPEEGLAATYYDEADFAGTAVARVDSTIDFAWGTEPPAPGIGPDTFSVRWTGRVLAPSSETYTFTAYTDDGARLWVDGELLVDRWAGQPGGAEGSGSIALRAGRSYSLLLEYYEDAGNGTAQLWWESASIQRRIVPPGRLSPRASLPDGRDNDGDGVPNDQDPDDDDDGIPDLKDPDRDGDGARNIVEAAGGTDPDDAASFPRAPGGGGCGATGLEAILLAGLAVRRRRRPAKNALAGESAGPGRPRDPVVGI